MANVKDFTGSVNVTDGEITPITRQKIEKITPENWQKMDINALWDQRIILNNRMVLALQAGHAEIAQQVQRGINTIDAHLQHRKAENESKESKESGVLL